MRTRRHQYNLRPRKKTQRKECIPEPSIGDKVSIFWESLSKVYDGTLVSFDTRHKTFLVCYDDTPDGYDDYSIWESLDYVPWRFVWRYQQFESRHATRRKASGRNPRIRKGSGRGVLDNCSYVSSEWFQPGELSAAHPQFCTLSNGCWRYQRRKRSKRIEMNLNEDYETGATFDEKETMDFGSDREVEETSQDGEEYDDEDEEGDYNGDLEDIIGEYRLFEEERSRANSMDIGGSQHGTKRKYANFGHLGFTKAHEASTSIAQQTNDYRNPSLCFPYDTVKVNCSEHLVNPVEGGQVLTDMKQRAADFFSEDQRIPFGTTGEEPVSPPTVEEQIRSITRSLGLSEENRLTHEEE